MELTEIQNGWNSKERVERHEMKLNPKAEREVTTASHVKEFPLQEIQEVIEAIFFLEKMSTATMQSTD